MARSVLVLAFAWLGAAVLTSSVKKGVNVDKKRLGHKFAHSVTFKTTLRVCNAYPYGTPLDVSIGEKNLTEHAMAYKECREFGLALKPRDKVEFSFGDARAGTFVVNDLPKHNAVLLLVIYRHDVESTAVAFESHVFTNLLNSQIAIMDTYRGPVQSTMRIEDAAEANTDRSEVLQFDNVVAINAGAYEVVLVDSDGELKARGRLVAQNRQSYVAIRCGVQPKIGKPYPEELMVYPPPAPEGSEPDKEREAEDEREDKERKAARSGAIRMGLASAALVLSLLSA